MKRREFIGSIAAASLLGAAGRIEASPVYRTLEDAAGKKKTSKRGIDESLVCLMTDIHLAPGAYQHDRIRKVVSDMLAQDTLPGYLIILGDLACKSGSKEEYLALKEVIKPVEDAGIRITMAMGNHDWRPNFAEVFPEYAAKSLVADRMVFTVETPNVDFIVLDSLIQPETYGRSQTKGEISESQRTWLETTLAAHSDKPVFVCAHHPLSDTSLDRTIQKYACVKGYLYGHDHRWRRDFLLPFGRGNGGGVLQTLCLPSTGQWGDLGYVMMPTTDSRADAILHQDDFFFPAPAASEDQIPLQWKLIVEQHKETRCSFALK